MKNLSIILLSLLFSLSSFAYQVDYDAPPKRVSELLRFIAHNAGIRNFALQGLISNRCNRYMEFGQAGACRGVVSMMLKQLDFDIIITDNNKAANLMPTDTWNPKSFVFVAFKKDLIARLSESRTTAYLQDLSEKLSQFLTGEIKDLNLWELTLAHYKTPFEAAKTMATLFQDTSKMRLHLGYLHIAKTKGNSHFENNKDRLFMVIDTINMVLDLSEDNFRSLFYPREVQKELNRNIYHFYVPLYLSMSLQAQKIKKFYSHAAPLMLTLTYEFITAAKDNRFLFTDPQYLDPRTHDYKLRDIFGGHSGALYGIGKKPSANFFGQMQDEFSRSTRRGVKLLLGQ